MITCSSLIRPKSFSQSTPRYYIMGVFCPSVFWSCSETKWPFKICVTKEIYGYFVPQKIKSQKTSFCSFYWVVQSCMIFSSSSFLKKKRCKRRKVEKKFFSLKFFLLLITFVRAIFMRKNDTLYDTQLYIIE